MSAFLHGGFILGNLPIELGVQILEIIVVSSPLIVGQFVKSHAPNFRVDSESIVAICSHSEFDHLAAILLRYAKIKLDTVKSPAYPLA
jgi:hypothetical protein